MSRTVIDIAELERLREAEKKLERLQLLVAEVEGRSRWLSRRQGGNLPVLRAIHAAANLVPLRMIW